jgi:hypothetical protein
LGTKEKDKEDRKRRGCGGEMAEGKNGEKTQRNRGGKKVGMVDW